MRVSVAVIAAYLTQRGMALRTLKAESLVAEQQEKAEQREADTFERGTWHQCGVEGDPLPKAGLVRFGWGMQWTKAAHLEAGSPCAIASFGVDPVPKIQKVCECMDSSKNTRTNRFELGLDWQRCASEGGTCACPGDNRMVRFGAGARWVVSQPGDQVAALRCAAESFRGEDPVLAQTKECWCGSRQAGTKKMTKAAIVLLSRQPPDLKTWLTYHLDYAGVDHIFMQLEDTPEFSAIYKALSPEKQARVTSWDGSQKAGKDGRPFDDYKTLQDRQLVVMTHARMEAAKMGIDWLFHTDDDELLYVPTHRPIGEVLANLPEAYEQAFIPNVEAVYDSADVKSCFTEAREVNVNPFTFVSYANGKSAVRVALAEDVVPAGPHFWHHANGMDLTSVHLDKEPFGAAIMVLHYESCPFKRWENKFWELSNTSEERIAAIPFKFYRESIRISRVCHSAPPELRHTQCTDQELKAMWAKWKTEKNSRYRRVDLMPLDIPWQSILGK